jgi:L-amino acid N-acyltransferase YncA
MRARPATRADVAAIVRIYNQGIEDRIATFETRPRTEAEIEAWLASPTAVADEDGRVLAFASSSAYSARPCYSHIAEFSVYTAREARRRGAGRAALRELMGMVRGAGIRKLTSKVLVENAASRELLKSMGFREVGVHEKHGLLEGKWHDVVVVEVLL